MNIAEERAAIALQTLLNEKFPAVRVVPGNARHSREPGIPLEIRGLLWKDIPTYQDFLADCLKKQRLKGPAILLVLDSQERLLNAGWAG